MRTGLDTFPRVGNLPYLKRVKPHIGSGFQLFDPLIEQFVDALLNEDFLDLAFHLGKRRRRRAAVVLLVLRDEGRAIIISDLTITGGCGRAQALVDQAQHEFLLGDTRNHLGLGHAQILERALEVLRVG